MAYRKTKVGELIQSYRVKADTFKNFSDMTVYGVSNKEGITITDHAKSKDLSSYLHVKEGCFAYNPYRINVGSIGLTPADYEGLVSPAYVVFEVKEKTIIPSLLLDFLKSEEGLHQISQHARGTVRKALRYEDLEQIELTLPDFESQVKIYSQKEQTDAKISIVVTEIEKQKALLSKYRQAILQEAIEGKLTKDWRAENPDVEPASELLTRIAAEKTELVKQKKIRKQKPLPKIKPDEIPFDIPNSWEWCRLGDITSLITSGSRNWAQLYAPVGSSFIRSQDIKKDRLEYDKRAFVRIPKGTEGTRTAAIQGDWLITITGGNVGKCAYLNTDPGDAYVSQHVGLMRPAFTELGEYGHMWLIAEYGGRGLLKESIYGAKPGLNLPQLRSLLIPLPTLIEQHEIVRRVEAKFALCDELEEQVNTSAHTTETLSAAILQELFSQNSER